MFQCCQLCHQSHKGKCTHRAPACNQTTYRSKGAIRSLCFVGRQQCCPQGLLSLWDGHDKGPGDEEAKKVSFLCRKCYLKLTRFHFSSYKMFCIHRIILYLLINFHFKRDSFLLLVRPEKNS